MSSDMTRRNISGVLDLDALDKLAGPDPRMRHFARLDQEQQAQAIRRLAYLGQSEDLIARSTGLSVEQIRRILGSTTP